MDASGESTKKDPIGRKLRTAIVLLAAVFVLWGLFTFVIVDRAMFLDYLRVLVWPLLVGAIVLWMRDPLRDKLRQLLRIEVAGGAAEFATNQLKDSIAPDVDSLLGHIDGATDNAKSDAPNNTEASDIESTSDIERHADIALSSQAPASGTQAESPGPGAAATTNADDAAASRADLPTENDNLTEFLLHLAQLMGATADERDTIKRHLDRSPDDTGVPLLMFERLAQRARPRSKNPAENRRNIEAIIQKSASWGYDMGASGAARVVPEVEWDEDGSWKITTEVPRRNPATRTLDAMSATYSRQVKDLEDEIRRLERERHSLLGMTNPASTNGLLAALKTRLRRLDPANIWGIE